MSYKLYKINNQLFSAACTCCTPGNRFHCYCMEMCIFTELQSDPGLLHYLKSVTELYTTFMSD